MLRVVKVRGREPPGLGESDRPKGGECDVERQIVAASSGMRALNWTVVVKRKLYIYQSIQFPTLTCGH